MHPPHAVSSLDLGEKEDAKKLQEGVLLKSPRANKVSHDPTSVLK